MAAENDKEKKPAAAEAAPPSEGEPKKKRFSAKTLILVGGVVLANALIIVAVLMFVHKSTEPAQAKAAAVETADGPAMVELSIIPSDKEGKIKSVNSKDGTSVYWQLKIHLRVPEDQLERVTKKLSSNENLVKQELTTIISGSDPTVLLQEADHATLKRQVRFALDKILGKGAFDDVLISECIPQPIQ